MNNGTRINELLNKQGFDWEGCGTVSLTSTSVGLKIMVNCSTSKATWYHINDIGNDTFQLTKGLFNNEIVDDNIPTSELSVRFAKGLAK